MHELSLIENIIDIILAEMPKHNLTKIEKITLRIGEMRQVVPDALQFGFECASKSTPVEGAELVIEHVPIKGRCFHCSHESIIENWYEPCSHCGSDGMEIIAGKELEIVDFEGS